MFPSVYLRQESKWPFKNWAWTENSHNNKMTKKITQMFIISGNCRDSNQNDFDCCIHVCNSNEKRSWVWKRARRDIWKGLDKNEGNWKLFIISKIKGRENKLPTLRFHLIPVNMPKINKTTCNKCWVVEI